MSRNGCTWTCRYAAKYTESCMRTSLSARRCRRSWGAKCARRPNEIDFDSSIFLDRSGHSLTTGGGQMKRMNLNLAAAVLASLGLGTSASAQNAPELSLTRFDCGKTSTLNDVSRFSDVSAFKGLNVPFTFSCYLVKHGNDYLVWD